MKKFQLFVFIVLSAFIFKTKEVSEVMLQVFVGFVGIFGMVWLKSH